MFTLTVLGNNGPYPAKGGACSGYLLQYDGTKILLDLGSGSLANLTSVLSAELESIDAIILTHLHSDHISDLSVFRYAIFRSGNSVGAGVAALKIPLYCPPGPQMEYEALCSYDQFDVHPITESLVLKLNGLAVSFAPMPHSYPAFAVSVITDEFDKPTISAAAVTSDASATAAAASAAALTTATGGCEYYPKFVYTGDTAWNLDLIQFCEGADLLLADANLISQDKLSGKPVQHLTAEECGIIAAEAGVTRLLLTHFTPGADISRRVAEARAGAQKVLGRSDSLLVEAAKILTSYEI